MSAAKVESETFLVAAEKWLVASKACSVHLAVEHKGAGPIKVMTFKHEAFLYTVFSVHYRPYGMQKAEVEAWRLVPESLYSGDATQIYHDKVAIEAGLRPRGDHTGLVVLVRGKRMVCAQKVLFQQELPTTVPMTQAEAEAHDQSESGCGWRALWYPGVTPAWHTLQGHPVARYCCHRTLGEAHSVLFWRHESRIEEMPIDDGVMLYPSRGITAQRDVITSEGGQMALF